jgi:MFS family permease
MARFIQGVAVGAPLLMGRAMINDTHNEQEATRQFGFLFSLAGLLICFLPLLGSFINSHFGWVGSFEVMAGYGFVLLLLCRGLSETRGPSHQAISLFVSISLVFRNNLFVRYLLISALMMAGESAFNTSASFILIQGAHYSQTAYGGVKTAMALTHVVGTLVCALLANYVTSASLVNYGLRLFAFAAGSMWLFTLNAYHVEWTFILPMMIYYFGTGFIVASTTAAAVRPFPKHMAIALALSLFCQFTLSAMASLITGLFAIERVIPFMILISVISILSLIIWSRSPGKSIYSRLIIEK